MIFHLLEHLELKLIFYHLKNLKVPMAQNTAPSCSLPNMFFLGLQKVVPLTDNCPGSLESSCRI